MYILLYIVRKFYFNIQHIVFPPAFRDIRRAQPGLAAACSGMLPFSPFCAARLF